MHNYVVFGYRVYKSIQGEQEFERLYRVDFKRTRGALEYTGYARL